MGADIAGSLQLCTIGSTGSTFAIVTSSTSPTTEITYTIGTPDYSADTSGSRTGWLVGHRRQRTTPASLNFSLGQHDRGS